jgi:hypothetical protein
MVFCIELQKRLVEHIDCTRLHIAYNLYLWDDSTVYVLTKEYKLNDYLYKYWTQFNKHLDISAEAYQYQPRCEIAPRQLIPYHGCA